MMHFTKKKIGLILGPLAFALVIMSDIPNLSESGEAVLASTIWIATWWVTESIPMAATSLLPIILLPLTGGATVKATTAVYGDKMLFLFIGGFMIAIAIEKWRLHKRIAMNIILAVGTNAQRIVLGFILATGFLSMWISNTATTLMMVTIGMALISQLLEYMENESALIKNNFGKALLLGIAYSASIGGLATLIGTPTNVIFTAMVQQIFKVEVTFADWLFFALPMVLVLLILSWWVLVKLAFPMGKIEIPGGKQTIQKELSDMGTMSPEEKLIALVFGLTALAWIMRSFVLQKLFPGIDDTVIALVGALVLFILPAKSDPGKKILDWESAVKLPWGIILLFGGGLSLAAAFQSSGLALWIGEQLTLLQGIHVVLLIASIAVFVNFMTEVTSNVATASIILPILASLAAAVGVHPYALMIAATLAASCAFMLPIATGPNAIVFGAGKLEINDMIRAGFRLNLISSFLIVATIYFLLPLVMGIDLGSFPDEFRTAFD
jgi:sodium-dependent dicarboxylate transporter 2/3/5